MTNEEKILEKLDTLDRTFQGVSSRLDLLAARGITETRFTSILLKSNQKQGTPLGQGACKAVILRANKIKTYDLDRASLNGGTGGGLKFYYGDSKQQTFEYLLCADTAIGSSANLRDSEIIFCKDLSDVWVRFYTDEADPLETLEIQIMIYR